MEINEAIEHALSVDDDRRVVAHRLGITVAMISHYTKRDNLPSLTVAAKLWGEYNLVVEPFTEKAVIKKWAEMQDVEV